MMNTISIENMSVKYDGYQALQNINLIIEHPSFVVVMGPNGAGKTTLLKSLLGLIPYQGKIKIFGKSPRSARNIIGYMPQRDSINVNVPLKVKEVVLLSLTALKMTIEKKDVEMAKRSLQIVGMEEFWDKSFTSLSGGQQQRVLLARTLAKDPKILILDEPFSATDVSTKMNLIRILHGLKREKTIILVTHDINPLVECTDKILLLKRKVIAYGDISQTLTEENMIKIYGTKVPVVRMGKICYTVGSDTHVHL